MSQDAIQNENSIEQQNKSLGLAPSISTDDSRRVVITAAVMVLLTGISALVFNLVHEALGRALLSVALVVVAAGIGLAFFNYLQPARIITASSAFLILTYFLVAGDGVHDGSITAYSAIVILSGLLLGEIGVLVFGTLTTVSLAALAYLEYFGYFTNKYSGLFDFIDATTIWFMQFATSAIVYFLVRRLSGLASQSRRGEEEFARANKELSSLRDVLQERIDQRTESLELQNAALQATSRVASELLAATDVTQLLSMTTDLVTKEFGYEHVGVFLLTEKKDQAILQAASSEGGRQMVYDHYQVPTDETSVVGAVAKNKSPRIALNQGRDAEFFKNPYLPGIQSEIALPLISQGEILGVLDIQSQKADAFTQGNIAIFQSLANQVALSIQNTRLVEEAQVNLSQLETLVAEQGQAVWGKHLKKRTYGFVYTPLGIKPLRTARLDTEVRPGVEKAEIPITLRGRKIGEISLQRISRHWTKKERALLSDVASQIGLAIENARLLHETREQAQQEQLVSDVSSRLRETLDMDTVLKTAVEEMKRTFNLKEVEVRLAPTNTPEETET